jgi:hypothetical protein
LFEEFEIKEVARQMRSNANIEQSSSPAGRSFQRTPFVAVGGHGYTLKQLWRYLYLPWVEAYRRWIVNTRPQQINAYRERGVWLIDDRKADHFGNLHGLPFMEQMPDMIVLASRHIPDADKGFTLCFWDRDFFGQSIVLDSRAEEGEWVRYRWKVWGVTGTNVKEGRMRRTALEARFKRPPRQIFVQAKKKTALSQSNCGGHHRWG